MTDQEKIKQLQASLKVAMRHWAAWCDEARGVHPTEIAEEYRDWMLCEQWSLAWTPQALGGIGGD